LHGANPWPSQLPGFAPLLRRYVGCALRLGSALLRGIALGLGLPGGTFTQRGVAPPADSYWVLRCGRGARQ
jgi:isopenicillin N synthase-like dioxygenase